MKGTGTVYCFVLPCGEYQILYDIFDNRSVLCTIYTDILTAGSHHPKIPVYLSEKQFIH